MNNLSQKMGMVKPQRTRWKSGDVCFMGMYAVPNMSVSFVSYPKDVMDHRLKPAYVHEGAKPFDRRYLEHRACLKNTVSTTIAPLPYMTSFLVANGIVTISRASLMEWDRSIHHAELRLFQKKETFDSTTATHLIVVAPSVSLIEWDR